MTMQAVRTVSETDDVHVIEGLLAFDGPFDGRDSYGTYFSARTAWGLDLHPQGIPVLYNHGFDNDFGMTPIGFTSPPASFRTDEHGLWVEMQLDKREKYYAARVRPLLDKNALGLSQGSAEHSVRIDEKSGEVLAWPLHEVSLTPTESNPYNVVAARSDEQDVIHVIEALRAYAGPPEGGIPRNKIPPEDYGDPENKKFPIVTQSSVDAAAKLIGKAANPTRVQKRVTAIAKRKGFTLPDTWEDPGDADRSDDWARDDARLKGLVARDEATRTEPEFDEHDEDAIRAGAVFSRKNQTHIDAIHQHAAAIMSHTGAMGTAAAIPADSQDDASRSAEPLTVHVTEREDVAAVRARLLATAAQVGVDTAKAMLD